jgi:hypothetical protein
MEAVDSLEDLVRSVVAGRVEQVLAPGRSQIVVRRSDRSLDRYTNYDAPVGCLPLPGWPRWSRRLSYGPYADPRDT